MKECFASLQRTCRICLRIGTTRTKTKLSCRRYSSVETCSLRLVTRFGAHCTIETVRSYISCIAYPLVEPAFRAILAREATESSSPPSLSEPNRSGPVCRFHESGVDRWDECNKLSDSALRTLRMAVWTLKREKRYPRGSIQAAM